MRRYRVGGWYWLWESENGYWVAYNEEESKMYVSEKVEEATEQVLRWYLRENVKVLEVEFDDENKRIIISFLDENSVKNQI